MLYEGTEYFILLPDLDRTSIAKELERANLTDSISWSSRNRVATFRIVNRIGFIRLFGNVLDVRSEKFYEGETGTRQFQLLLDDLVKLSRQIIFDYSSPTSSYRTHLRDAGASILERFNFYQQRFFANSCKNSIAHCIDLVISNPHSRLRPECREELIWNVRQPNAKTMRSMVSHSGQLIEITGRGTRPPKHVAGSAALRASRRLFPLRVDTTRNVVDENTPENRFVKHVLMDIEHVCLEVMADPAATKRVLIDCTTLLHATRRYLRQPFFRNVGSLDYFPSSSPTLLSRHGYRELYSIFLRSRTGARHLFQDLVDESTFIDLKDVAQLYEYWVFYRTVVSLLGGTALVLEKDVTIKNGRLVNSIEIGNSDIRIAFNKTFTRKTNASYSLAFRPDICITLRTGQDEELLVLDAKYKSVESNESGADLDLVPGLRIVKAADLHKMHCYVDAIQGARAAIAIYPGDRTVFYHRDHAKPVSRNFPPDVHLNGVGAVPLAPGKDSRDFDALMKAVLNRANL